MIHFLLYVNRIITCEFLYDWVIKFNIVSLRFFPVKDHSFGSFTSGGCELFCSLSILWLAMQAASNFYQKNNCMDSFLYELNYTSTRKKKNKHTKHLGCLLKHRYLGPTIGVLLDRSGLEPEILYF